MCVNTQWIDLHLNLDKIIFKSERIRGKPYDPDSS